MLFKGAALTAGAGEGIVVATGMHCRCYGRLVIGTAVGAECMVPFHPGIRSDFNEQPGADIMIASGKPYFAAYTADPHFCIRHLQLSSGYQEFSLWNRVGVSSPGHPVP